MPALGWDIIMWVVVFSVYVDMGIDQVVGLGIKCPSGVVLSLLGMGV